MKNAAERDKNVEHASKKGTGFAVATLQDLRFTDIRGEFEHGNVYMIFALNDGEYGVTQYINVSVMRDGLQKKEIILPSPYVRSWIQFGASNGEPTEGRVVCVWDEANLHAVGEFELIAPFNGTKILKGTFDVTVPGNLAKKKPASQ
ncbi:hypothetical protein ACN079_09395 [Pseudomonas sp. ABY48]|uniref:hypothetical protein n=1 Tax=Pseudomonas sp. ABY48 TaxID=3402865 RepID=UPI003B42AE58